MKIICYIKVLTIICVLLCSCGKAKRSYENVKRINTVRDSVKSIGIETITLDSVYTSYKIQTSLTNGQIVGVDQYFCYLYRFTSEGKLIKRQLGQGSAKNETSVGRIAGHCFTDKGKLILVGFQGETIVYDSSINREKIVMVDYSKRNITDLATTACYENPLVYTKSYNDFVCRDYDGILYFNVDMFTPIYNIVNTPETQVNNVRSLMSVDYSKKGETALWVKGLPSYYEDDTAHKALFTNAHFDISNKGDIYVAHEADSLIYIYDKRKNLQTTCGRAGTDMLQDYAKCNRISDFRKYYEEEHEKKGRYTSLEYIDETDLLFRTYQRDGVSKQDGMQIYKDGVLIGDVSVPRGMHVVGYISPYYYSQIMSDEDKCELKIYRFRL